MAVAVSVSVGADVGSAGADVEEGISSGAPCKELGFAVPHALRINTTMSTNQ
jgi:hypothetical protein